MAAGFWLDSFLLAAGIDQILDDALHPEPLAGRAAVRLGSFRGRPWRLAAVACQLAATVLWMPESRFLNWSRAARCHALSAALVGDLARVALAKEEVPDSAGPELLSRAKRLKSEIARLPGRVRHDLLRLPSGFLSQDQSPEDVEELVRRVAELCRDRDRPALVVGVRTSGSYLAPLAAAALEAAGQREVTWMTLRLGTRWLPGERRQLRQAVRRDALVLLVDDPPRTWGTLAKAALLLGRLGVRPGSLVPLAQTYAAGSPPPQSLLAHPLLVLPWEHWQVHRQLASEAVQAALAKLLAPSGRVGAVRRLSLDGGERRGHARAQYEVEIALSGRLTETRRVYAEGVGLGYFGGQTLAVAERLPTFLPAVYGVSGGILLREWLPESGRLGAEADLGRVAESIVSYVGERARALGLPDDPSRRLRRRQTLARWVGRFLAQPFGRLRFLAYPLTEDLARRLLEVREPSVIDGKTSFENWFATGSDGRELKKIGYAERAFDSYELVCFDQLYDLAGAVAGAADGLQSKLSIAFAAAEGKPPDQERWLIYQLAHLLSRRSEPELADPELERSAARCFQRYFEATWLADLRPARTGALCAIDLDGVLETTPLGICALSLESARTLRALALHGYSAVLASGRSLAEIRDRCLAYHLVGGVAEYGAVVYVTAEGTARNLLSENERVHLARVRAFLESQPDLRLDPGSMVAVRAYRRGANGRRLPLLPEQIEQALAAAPPGAVRTIQGLGQTDFMVTGVTKATGLVALAAQLGLRHEERPWLALAVGDSESDQPMLKLARLACVPSHASAQVRATPGVSVMSHSYQAGFEEAAARLLGHRPGRCSACRQPELSQPARVLFSFLRAAAYESSGAKLAWACQTLFACCLSFRGFPLPLSRLKPASIRFKGRQGGVRQVTEPRT